MLISIFTPTYNRSHTLTRLYDSLCHQKRFNFEWIIVDDGSNDNSDSLINSFIKNTALFDIKYIRANHGGKHRAINTGVSVASGKLFFIVDSDDYLTSDATEKISDIWEKNDKNILGLCFRRIDPSTRTNLGKPFPKSLCYATPQKINYLWNITQDKAEIFCTDVLKQHPFPTFENENFCTEALWVYRLCKKKPNKLLCSNEGIRFTEYLEDGLTKNINNIRRSNPKGYIAYYKILFTLPYFYLHPKCILYALYSIIQLTILKH